MPWPRPRRLRAYNDRRSHRRPARPPREARCASRALGSPFRDPLVQAVEVGVVGWTRGRRRRPLQQQLAQMLAVLVLADQLAHIFAAGAVAALGDLLVDEAFEVVWK